MSTSFHLGPVCGMLWLVDGGRSGFWLRVLGRGFGVDNHPPSFSERNGHNPNILRIGHIRLRTLQRA